jgi:GNAT superfamily N-acetyltransferase
MKHLDPADLARNADVLLTRNGTHVKVRFAEVADGDALQAYFRGLSPRSRYNRLMGAASELPAAQLEAFTHIHHDGRFSVLVTIGEGEAERVVGEARYALDEATGRFEFGLSVADHLQGMGLGTALLSNLQCRAEALGADRMFGDTLRTNDAMLALARQAGFTVAPTPGDWKQVRFEKRIYEIQPAARRPMGSEAAMHR